MKREIVVNSCLVETRVAVLEDGTLVEVLIDDAKNKSIAGSIYKGKVKRILPGMQAAFVDIGLNKDAFLYVRDIYEDVEEYERLLGVEEGEELEEELPPPKPKPKGRRPQASIEEILQEGQEVLVQVAREPMGTKGARLTSRITLPGRYLVYMPAEQHIGVSRKIESESERQRLKQVIEEINPNKEGIIVRTAGIGRSKADLQADLGFLRALWKKIRAKAETLTAPSLVHQELDLIFRIFRDMFTKEVAHLVVDSPGEYERCLEYAESLHPDLKSLLFLYTEDEPIFKSFGIEKELEKALKRKVWLKSGGSIVIEETEALISVDVNTGKYVGKHDFEETILKTNLEAAGEVARQVRLRDLGGILIVDFIDMARQENRERVLNELREGLKADRSPTNISLISELGLVEMTRKRVKQGLTQVLSQACPLCGGLGRVRSNPSLARQILREAEWRFFKKRLPRLKIKAHPDVIVYLQDEEAEVIQGVQESYGGEIILMADENLPPGKCQLLEG
ncbi:MAG: Rne/Rng family ribonuclease [candidate division NC10 bacterium]|nr:Rne/Rng family ribonuclease [candidate division NC10 bacterium]